MQPPKTNAPVMEFHISRQARDRYQFDEALFTLTGNVIIPNFQAARTFALKMNAKRDLIRFPEKTVRAGQINAMGLIDEILHIIFKQYREKKNTSVLPKAMAWLSERIGVDEVDRTLAQFADEFPPLQVYRQEKFLDDYLSGDTEGTPNKHIVLEELIMLWMANNNPAFSPYIELFDDRVLEDYTAYLQIMDSLEAFFETQPGFGPKDEKLLKLLQSPAKQSPHSLSGQLKFIREHWASMLGKYLHQLLSSLDFIREEEKPMFMGPGPAKVLKFEGLDLLEEERFSQDLDWMPRLVLLAKNAYVWLDQLSKKYKHPINRLDQVPEEELDLLAQRGFTGLWLIGLWERSSASKRIKQLCGNPDAVASAYSLYDYTIANRLGGEQAYDNLRGRAWQRGIRLAADMVPNHVGIYSKWIIEHPDWFLSLDYNPFPTYTFNGENLSEDNRVGIYLEDHYYSREDAAVVFKRVDHWTGDEKYIYHGNDGTSMPWNDTAQLNYLLPEVREAVIQTILHVARKFSVIRFDAAMTLAKKHFHRLWFPEPGSGGDIPSRSEFGLTRSEFNDAMPMEFWREVVDRVAQEVPDTLLLAEAFWMMEGYFVRTLGMHRVYNSAFMNMLRDEKNDQYRQLIKNTLEFDPEILKRYVNFMNNPDEKTAIEQFGKDDKYFGICTLMVTMPGLPMFGHGQVEGFHEKYGMEYYRGYWDEQPDDHLIHRHENEIFPLLHRRYLFADVQNFFLYDFFNSEGRVEENVFAYSNRIGEPGTNDCQRALVIYHNRWADVRGWIKTSCAYKDKWREDDHLIQTNLGQGLGLQNEHNVYTIFTDHITGLEYIRHNPDIFQNGLYIELGAYKYQVFINFREVKDNEWGQYEELSRYLAGRGVPNIEETLKEIVLEPLLNPLRDLIQAETMMNLIENRTQADGDISKTTEILINEVEEKSKRIFFAISRFQQKEIPSSDLAEEISLKLRAVLSLPRLTEMNSLTRSYNFKGANRLILTGNKQFGSLLEGDSLSWGILLGWTFTHNLGKVLGEEKYEVRSRRLIDEWLIGNILANSLQDMEIDAEIAWNLVTCIKALVRHQNWYLDNSPKRGQASRILESWIKDEDIHQYLNINKYAGILWFTKEAMESILRWMLAIGTINLLVDDDLKKLKNMDSDLVKEIAALFRVIKKIQKASDESEYQLEKLLAAVK